VCVCDNITYYGNLLTAVLFCIVKVESVYVAAAADISYYSPTTLRQLSMARCACLCERQGVCVSVCVCVCVCFRLVKPW